MCVPALFGHGQHSITTAAKPPSYTIAKTKISKGSINYKIIPAHASTYGYEIFINGKKKIKQLTIPAMAGSNGFASREDAVKVAELVKQKIARGEMPPTVKVEELKTLNITSK